MDPEQLYLSESMKSAFTYRFWLTPGILIFLTAIALLLSVGSFSFASGKIRALPPRLTRVGVQIQLAPPRVDKLTAIRLVRRERILREVGYRARGAACRLRDKCT